MFEKDFSFISSGVQFQRGICTKQKCTISSLFKLFCLILNFSVKSSGKSDTGNKISQQLLQDVEFTRLNISELETQSSLPKTKYVHVKCKYHHIAFDLLHACRQSNSTWTESCILGVSHS